MAIKLVAIDIDGTLLNEKREVTKEVKRSDCRCCCKRGLNRFMYWSPLTRCPRTVKRAGPFSR